MPLKADALSLEQLLDRYPALDVPNYQRTFKWENDYVTDLFQDIIAGLDLTEKGKSRGCFLGSIVVCEDPATKRWDLVDGQQRLTTLTILLSLIGKKADARTRGRLTNAICQPDGISPKILHKSNNKTLCSDRDAYREVALKDNPDSEKGEVDDAAWYSEFKRSLIYKASLRLKNLSSRVIEFYMEETGCKSDTEAASKIYDKIATGVKLIAIETDERKEGMRVFASINASGTRLEPWEVIMSAFYSHGPSEVSTKRVEAVFESDTYSITKVLGGDKADDAAINNGLRTYWLTTQRFARMDDLFDEFNDRLGKADAKKDWHTDMLKEIYASIPFLRAFDAPSRGAKSRVKPYDSYDLEFIHPLTVILKDKLARPILLGTILRTLDDHDNAIDALQRVSFALERARMRLVMCRLGANFIEKPYSTFAIDVRKGKFGEKAADIEAETYKFLKTLKGFPGKDELRSAFRKYDAYEKNRQTKMMASRMQEALEYPQNKERWYTYAPTPGTKDFEIAPGILLPDDSVSEDRAKNMGFSSPAAVDQFVRSLGNVFILPEGNVNIPPSNKFNGGIVLSKFDERKVKERRDALVELALDIWHF
jgi:hypothetical protein